MDIEYLKERFLSFAETECKGNSDLYYRLSFQIANDTGLLNIALNTRQGQPIPNIFFATIHYLLLKDQNNELAKYYPSIRKNLFTEIPYNIFKAFCLTNKNEIKKNNFNKDSSDKCYYPLFILNANFLKTYQRGK